MKRVIIPTIAGIITAIGTLMLRLPIFSCLLITIGVWAGLMLINSPEKKQTEQSTEIPFELRISELDNQITRLKRIEPEIEKESMQDDLRDIIDSLTKIRNTVVENKEKFYKNSKIFDYYIPMSIGIIEKYNEIEDKRLTSADSKKFMQSSENVIAALREGFKNVLNGLYESDIVNANAEIQTLETVMKMGGFN